MLACFSFEPILIDLFGACVGEDPRRMSFVGLYGHGEGYTIVQFVMMYVIGAVIKKKQRIVDLNAAEPADLSQWLVIIIVCLFNRQKKHL